VSRPNPGSIFGSISILLKRFTRLPVTRGGPVQDLLAGPGEDADELRRILSQRYHVVVGNPPYINAKDKQLADEYRRRFSACFNL